jgi:hypothetical protein
VRAIPKFFAAQLNKYSSFELLLFANFKNISLRGWTNTVNLRGLCSRQFPTFQLRGWTNTVSLSCLCSLIPKAFAACQNFRCGEINLLTGLPLTLSAYKVGGGGGPGICDKLWQKKTKCDKLSKGGAGQFWKTKRRGGRKRPLSVSECMCGWGRGGGAVGGGRTFSF